MEKRQRGAMALPVARLRGKKKSLSVTLQGDEAVERNVSDLGR